MISLLGRLSLLVTVSVALFIGSSIVLRSILPKTGHAAINTEPLDINSATLEQLTTLPGIGAASSQRIIEGRPYSEITELIERSIISQTRYDKIKEQIVAKSGPRRS